MGTRPFDGVASKKVKCGMCGKMVEFSSMRRLNMFDTVCRSCYFA